MARNSKFVLAALAGMNERALGAAIASGSLSKSDLTTILALRANGGAIDEIAKCLGQKIIRDFRLRKIGKAIGRYAKQRVTEVMPMPTLLEQNIAKAADVQKALREAIAEDQRTHPGRSRRDSIDKILFSAPVRDMHRAEQLAKARNTLPQDRPVPEMPPLPTPRPGTMHRQHNSSNPVLGETGYSSARDDRSPGRPRATGGPQSGDESKSTVEDHHEVLARLTEEGMKLGKTHAKAVTDAADSEEFKRAFRAYKANMYGV